MNREDIYFINESSGEYPIYTCAVWIRAHDLPFFHLLRTLEESPRVLSIYKHNIRKATPEEIGRWMRLHPHAR